MSEEIAARPQPSDETGSSADDAVDIADEVDAAVDRAGREPGDLVIGMSPRQIIGGFALLAGLIIMLRRRGRRKG